MEGAESPIPEASCIVTSCCWLFTNYFKYALWSVWLEYANSLLEGCEGKGQTNITVRPLKQIQSRWFSENLLVDFMGENDEIWVSWELLQMPTGYALGQWCFLFWLIPWYLSYIPLAPVGELRAAPEPTWLSLHLGLRGSSPCQPTEWWWKFLSCSLQWPFEVCFKWNLLLMSKMSEVEKTFYHCTLFSD